MSLAVRRCVAIPRHDAGMTNTDRRPAPSTSDARVGLLSVLGLLLALTYGLPLAIILWRAAL